MIGLGLRLPQIAVRQRTGGFIGALDALSAAAAYSTRRLRSDYTGPCMRVRRSSDNVEADIGFRLYAARAYPWWLDEEALLAHVGGVNGLLWSEDWSNAVWAKTAATVADKTITSTTNSSSGVSQTVSYASGAVSYSVTVLTSGTTSPWLRVGFTDGITFFAAWGNISTGAIGTVNAGVSMTSTAVPGGWRFTLVRTATATSGTVFIRLAVGDNDNNSVNGHTLVVDRAQLNAGASPAPYQLTTTATRDGNGFVTTWYEQSANARHMTQGTAANQPRIVNAGVLDTDGGRPALWLTNSFMASAGYAPGVTSWSFNTVLNPSASNGAFGMGVVLSPSFIELRRNNTLDDWQCLFRNGGAVSDGVGLGARKVNSVVAFGTGARIFANGTLGALGGGTPAGITLVSIGNRTQGGTFPYTGSVQELTVFATALSDADRQTLERNQGAAFSITVA